ncbi:MAG TPA: cbb3-type cytochrome oxidase assembly protein CcoS [Chitinolyticbacter sp.]|nr:cbb3-type cytochrome oxidase assembly protein CcoS [Chitinolyticbacter sp.]
MESLYLLIPLSVLIALGIGAAFWWSVKSGQLDDLEGPAHRIFHDDDMPRKANENEASEQKTRD